MKTEQRNIFPHVMVVLALMLILLVVTSVTALASDIPVGNVAYVNVNDYLNMRAEPQGQIIGQIARGEVVTILSGPDRNNYYQARVNKTGEVCYLYGEYLTESYIAPNTSQSKGSNSSSKQQETYPHTGKFAVVQSNRLLNLRKGPKRSADRIEYLKNGQLVEILDEIVQNNYIKVLADDKVGYVDIDYLNFIQSTTDQSTTSTSILCNCLNDCYIPQ